MKKVMMDKLNSCAVVLDSDDMPLHYIWPGNGVNEFKSAKGFHVGMAMQNPFSEDPRGHVRLEETEEEFPYPTLTKQMIDNKKFNDVIMLMRLVLEGNTDCRHPFKWWKKVYRLLKREMRKPEMFKRFKELHIGLKKEHGDNPLPPAVLPKRPPRLVRELFEIYPGFSVQR